MDNRYYAGCNIENVSFSLTICAESAAIANMITHGAKQIAEIVIMAEHKEICPPCGACRQRIYEFSNLETKIHLCTKDGLLKNTITIEQLLPGAFTIEAENKCAQI